MLIRPHPTLEEQEAAGCAAGFYPQLTTMAALQSTWEFLHEFKEKGTATIDDFIERASNSKYGLVEYTRVFNLRRIREMEEKYLPKDLRRDYENTLGRQS